MVRFCTLVFSLCCATLLFAQSPSSVAPSRPRRELSTHLDWPKANQSDVDTIEDTVRAFFSAISTPAPGKLNRDRLHSLFVPDGRIAVGLPGRNGNPADVIFMTPDQYADSSDAATASDGFFDRNIANRIQHFGVMAQVYSTYESRSHPDDKKPMARGIKSFELLNSANRWYIVQVYWDSERPDNPIPDRYLRDSKDDDTGQR